MNDSFKKALGDLGFGAVFFYLSWFSPAQVYKSWELSNFVYYGFAIIGIRHISRSLIGDPMREYFSRKDRERKDEARR